MTSSELIVVADLGGLKAYRLHDTPSRGPKLKLVQAFDIANVNDLSQRRHTRALAEWSSLESEEKRRTCRQLANEITSFLRRQAAERWLFAAPESIYAMIVKLLPTEITERMIEHVESDLVHIPAGKLPDHFRSLQGV